MPAQAQKVEFQMASRYDCGMESSSATTEALAARLEAFAKQGPGDAYYRLSRVVARVLVCSRLRHRFKWRDLACKLSETPGVEHRLILQAMRWLQRIPPATSA